MADPFGMLNNAIALVRKVQDVADATKSADLKLLAADLKNAIADLKNELADVKEENLRLQRELRAATEKQNVIPPKVMFRDNAVWYDEEPPPGRPTGPYCLHCFQTTGRLLLLSKPAGPATMRGSLVCAECKNFFGPATR